MKNYTWLGLSLISIFVLSCANETVKLPVNGVEGIQDPIYDNTQIWMFYKNNNDQPELILNKNNKISSTNWVFNIDKRLPMNLVAPEIEALVNSRKKSTEGKTYFNYLSYVDTLHNKMSTVKFNRVLFKTVDQFPTPIQNAADLSEPIKISIKRALIELNGIPITTEKLLHVLKENTAKSSQVELYMSHDIPYGRYLYVKALIAPHLTVTKEDQSTSFLVEF